MRSLFRWSTQFELDAQLGWTMMLATNGKPTKMSFRNDTRRYENWLRRQCDVVEADLIFKHKRMKKSVFVFLRATYYRWARKIEAWCPELSDAPNVLAIGDTHTENFGTWRDGEGRLVWGVNDFDEAAVMPYPFDLVRLATSALLAPGNKLSPNAVAGAILGGYRRAIEGPRPTLLDEHQTWMRSFVVGTDAGREKLWRELGRCADAQPPKEVVEGLTKSLPKGAGVLRFCSRVKGGGSLGRPRYAVIATWRGGQIAREAKALVPSAWVWSRKSPNDRSMFMTAATGRYRSPDPFLDAQDGFVYRRIAPDSSKVELGDDAGRHLSGDLLAAMGFDLGSIHAARRKRVKRIIDDLSGRKPGWLVIAAKRAAAAVRDEYAEWRGTKTRHAV